MNTAEYPPTAIEQQSRWPGWIWAIPVAALAIVAWLGVRSWTSAGPKVTVIFPTIADLKAGNTEVRFQDLTVGRVKSVSLEKDFRHMRVKLQLDSTVAGNVGKGTKFWIEGKNFTFTKLSDLKAVVSGPYVAMQPAPGPVQDQYIGLADAPVLKFGERATQFTLQSATLSGIQRGTPVLYLDEQVGEVRSYRMIDGRGFDIVALIRAPFDKLVRNGTRFWKASAIHLSNGANGPKLEFASIPSLVEGAIAFETPSPAADSGPAKAYSTFYLYDSQDAAQNAPDPEDVIYRAVFNDPSTALSKGAPVQLMGSVIGSVSETTLQYSPETGKLSIDALIAIEPQRIHLANGQTWTGGRRQADTMMHRLIAQGLRAEISASPPVIGGHIVVLRLIPNTRGLMIMGTIPEIPTASGSDIGNTVQAASDFMNKLNELPLEQIGDEIHQSSQHIARLVASPSLPKTLHQVQDSTANIDRITAEARDQLPAALSSARKSIEEAQATLASTQALVSANPAESAEPESADVPRTLYELTRAARSLRELSEFLDRHPEALIEGRGLHQ
jgi:paraquat-inducible protein B